MGFEPKSYRLASNHANSFATQSLLIGAGIICATYCSKTSYTDHLYRSTTSLYRPAFNVTEIQSTVYTMYYGEFYKSTTSLNGPAEFTPANGRYREVLLYIFVLLDDEYKK